MILQDQGDLDGARQQIAPALAIRERVFGPDSGIPLTTWLWRGVAAWHGAEISD